MSDIDVNTLLSEDKNSKKSLGDKLIWVAPVLEELETDKTRSGGGTATETPFNPGVSS
ncbi:hypothetical protein [Marinomonas mediterranea]|jgi:hypothetical protein|uniref:Uncharacterized protein n=1 Tax=Marinomonas mediterranea (strain ATCC 700492 / JCM 21426 / NBRC 103028 / MMB-1) TaxID=717774 RepID=F2JVI5_MARM1|nr:hypothetical protein [Marinomonas mediterranea]ADZ90529.1 hypothetical protein Marme_1256 [Marinomonas mediterranea MMB-1]WCN16708.1 hypothetical protein GV053_06355 [Marinomonas mediterranea MMB-1]